MVNKSHTISSSGKEYNEPEEFSNYQEQKKDKKGYDISDLFKDDYETREAIFERVKYVQK